MVLYFDLDVFSLSFLKDYKLDQDLELSFESFK
jgi:hypothetical protein